MKKVLIFSSIVFLFCTCSTELDMLDNWKETTVVYCLFDQSQPKQYVRIEKAFLGPDNALSMAQNYDSIYYINQLDVWMQEIDQNGVVVNYFQLSPDTIPNKEPGIFYAPNYVLYSMNTPVINATHSFKLIITNVSTGNVVDATTTIIKDFNITRPSGPTLSLIKISPTTMIDVQWAGTPNARIYQVSCKFHYKERDLSNNITFKVAPEWTISSIETDSISANIAHGISFDPNAFYKYLATVLSNDPNVSARESDYLEFIVYAGGEALQTFMAVNSPSNSLVQERPLYTNINNGLGVFSCRYQKVKTNLTITPQTEDTLSKGQYSCHLQFLDRNATITNILDLPPGCQ